MIYTTPSTAFSAVLSGAPTGLVGTLTAKIENLDGTTQTAATTAAIIEADPGIYVATRTSPLTPATYLVIWNNAGTLATEELVVTLSAAPPGGTGGVPGTGKTFDQLVARLRSPEGGGFGITLARAGEVINQAVRRIVVESQVLKDEVQIATGDGSASKFDLPDNVVDVVGLKVAGDPSYIRLSTMQFWDYEAGNGRIPDAFTGAYGPRFTGEVKQISITPTPAAGAAIVALVALSSPDYSTTDRPPLPIDSEDAILWAAKAIAYEEIDEDFNTASAYSDKAGGYAAMLKARETSRVGGGVIQAQIQGVHFR